MKFGSLKNKGAIIAHDKPQIFSAQSLAPFEFEKGTSSSAEAWRAGIGWGKQLAHINTTAPAS